MSKRKYFYETEETFTRKMKGYVEIDMEYVQYYRGLVAANARLSSPCALKFLPFLFFELNQANSFALNSDIANRFNQLCSPTNPYSYRTIRAAIKEMVDAGIVHKMSNAHYWIDPDYCWMGSIKERIDMLKNKQMMLDASKDDSLIEANYEDK